MKTKLSIIVGGLAIMTLFAGDVYAQRTGRGGGRGGGMSLGRGPSTPLQLAGIEAVQKEIGLKEAQVEKVKAISADVRDEMRASAGNFRELQQLPEDERTKKMKEMRTKAAEANRKLTEKFLPKLAEVLDGAQMERLKQIAWQAAGTRAYEDADVVKALGISKEQQDKLAAFSEEHAAKTREAFVSASAGGDAQERVSKFKELNDKYGKQAAEVLTKEQQDKFEKLKGKPFDLAQLRRGPGGEGRPNAAGGRSRRRPAPATDDKKSSDKT